MKATIEVPDDLYRRVKARCALEGRPIREVTESLYRAWLEDEDSPERASFALRWTVVPGGPQPGVDVADRDRLDERMDEPTGRGS